MLCNLHTHTTFCDGKNTPEEIVLCAIDKGFDALGFSGHAYTPFDLSYCVNETDSYIAEIKRLKEKYKDKIELYLGIEEDAAAPFKREPFDYVIGSSHYFFIDNKNLPIDQSAECFKKCLEAFGSDILKLAESYYIRFISYLTKYRPDIIGHFDLILKYEEVSPSGFFGSEEYFSLTDKYAKEASKLNLLFEVNTGAMARGYRTKPYPHERILHTLKKSGAGIILSSDCHEKSKLDFEFEETKRLLKDIGFEHAYALKEGNFKKYSL